MQTNRKHISESPDHVRGVVGGKSIENSFHDHNANAFVYDIKNKRFYMGSERSQHAHLFDWIMDEVWDDNPDWDIREVGDYVRDLLARNSDTGINGRVWFDDEVVSFWNMPSIDVLRNMVNDCDFDLEDFYVDEGNNEEMRTVGQILKSAEVRKTNFDLNTIHNMSAAEKHNTPQLRGARDSRDNLKAQKLGNTPEAEYNFYRNYGIGDSVRRSGNIVKESPDNVYIGKKGDEHNAEIPTNQLFAGWRQANAHPFVYSVEFDALFIGDERDKHQKMRQDILTGLYNIMADRGMEINPGTETHMRHYLTQLLDRDSDEGVMGRVWTNHKIISFWKFPDKAILRKIVNHLEDEIGNMDGYRVDTDDGLIPLSQILYGNDTIQTNFDLSKIHTMGAKEKHDTPQMRAARNSRDSLKAQKLGDNSEAQYNFYRNYGIGDSVNRTSTGQVNEVEADDVSLNSFRVKDELNPKFWLNNKLNSKVRQRLLDIAGDFMDETAIKWIKPEDIVFTGSMANYNWSRYSDVDVHIMVDYKKVYPKDPDFVEDYFDAKKELWADTHEGLKIYGYPVEVYVEDTNKKNTSTGIYSLNKNKWIVEPGDFEDATINASYVKKEAAKIMTEIDNITKRAENTNDDKKLDKCSEDLKKIFDKLKKIRKDGLKKGGEMSSGNIIWKICRRMGYLDKLWDSVNKSYDKINSIR